MGILYPFFGIHCFMNLAKAQIPRNSVCVDLSPYQFRFVWRQLESAFFGAVNAVFESETFNSLITDAGKRLEEEIPQIIEAIRKLNPNAKIYFQTVYNPYKGMNVSLKEVTEQLKLDDYGERSVANLNAPIEALADSLGYEIVPVWTEFEESGKDLVNAGISLLPFNISVDPHPNWQGHELIAKIYCDIITEAK